LAFVEYRRMDKRKIQLPKQAARIAILKQAEDRAADGSDGIKAGHGDLARPPVSIKDLLIRQVVCHVRDPAPFRPDGLLAVAVPP
jgi:hypothetical protein